MRALVLLAAATACMAMPGPQTFSLSLPASRATHQTTLGDKIHELGLDVSMELQKPGNVVISPLSISALLSVLMMGSAGRTRQELLRGLHFDDAHSENDVHLSFQRLMEDISSDGPDVTLNVANGLFLQRGAGVLYNFTQKARTHYNSVVSTLDFHNSSVKSTETINNWIKESTSGMIPNLFKQPLDPPTTFVAVNTVFFNGKWLTPFDPMMTKDREFDTGAGKVQVPIMSNTFIVNYIDIPELEAHMAAFPYKGNRQAMYVILPTGQPTANLEPLELELSAEKINSLIGKMTPLEMRVWLPRMRLSFKSSLRDTLKKLHMASMFNPAAANFSRLTTLPVWVDDVLHETVIEVSEEGTKAAAATGSDFNRMGTSRTFIINRPAIIFIRDEVSGVPLFWGRLVRPEPLRT
ncbi:LOW QUALITY PROTEIN: leukocyte elastase inhibitor-like [Portunus trituberculatus]|uniref:LOW QUALITY PROTEIN: leukocyte elastase inhibitor-like n=1 Tax=Portunus trituberculatus TaxID=210409 RepID=UPI001E1CE8D8|nr:LOW QUALITY PROTEIN: leukocyte elastase inhibitor-like [Portunus trituberculatus]